MANVSPFAAFSRAMRFESSTILGEGPFCRNALRSPGRAIKIRTERNRVKAARNQAWTERNRAWTERNRAWTERNRAWTKRNRAWTATEHGARNRASTKRNRVWIRARHEAQSPNARDHRVAEHVLNFGRSGDYNLRSKSPRRPTTKTPQDATSVHRFVRRSATVRSARVAVSNCVIALDSANEFAKFLTVIQSNS